MLMVIWLSSTKSVWVMMKSISFYLSFNGFRNGESSRYTVNVNGFVCVYCIYAHTLATKLDKLVQMNRNKKIYIQSDAHGWHCMFYIYVVRKNALEN